MWTWLWKEGVTQASDLLIFWAYKKLPKNQLLISITWSLNKVNYTLSSSFNFFSEESLLVALSLLSCLPSSSSSNKSLIKALHQQDSRACNRKNQAAVSFFVRGGKDWTKVGFFAKDWPADVELAFFVPCNAIVY